MNKDQFVERFVRCFLVNWSNKFPNKEVHTGDDSTNRKLAETIAETIYENVRVFR